MDKSQHALHVVVVGSGEFARPTRLVAALENADVIIAADGGANWLVSQGRLPDVIVGDMDSISQAVMEALQRGGCRFVRHPAQKDETDLELALLEALAMGAKRITVLGALGKRIDHTLANILLLAMPQLADVETVIYDGLCSLYVLRHTGEVRGEVGDTVSLIPLGGDVKGVVTSGLAYPLRDEVLRFGPARGVSNVLLEPRATITLREGILLVVHIPKVHVEGTNEPSELS